MERMIQVKVLPRCRRLALDRSSFASAIAAACVSPDLMPVKEAGATGDRSVVFATLHQFLLLYGCCVREMG